MQGCTQLVHVDTATGRLTNIGQGHQPLAAVGEILKLPPPRVLFPSTNLAVSLAGDLAVIAHGVYYYLGDGWNGTGDAPREHIDAHSMPRNM